MSDRLPPGDRFYREPDYARPLAEWTEEDGDVLWWRFPVAESPYVGTPLDLGQTIEMWAIRNGRPAKVGTGMVGGWPGYHTHWTRLPSPPVGPRS